MGRSGASDGQAAQYVSRLSNKRIFYVLHTVVRKELLGAVLMPVEAVLARKSRGVLPSTRAACRTRRMIFRCVSIFEIFIAAPKIGANPDSDERSAGRPVGIRLRNWWLPHWPAGLTGT